MSEKFVFEGYDDDIEFETWAFWENLIPYDNDVIVITGETLNKNVGQQRKLILDSINSFKIINHNKPVFFETSLSNIDESSSNPPTNIEPLSIPQSELVDERVIVDKKYLELGIDYLQKQLKRYEPIQLKISGQLDDYTRGARILFIITDPNGETTEQKVIATKDGKYENILWFDRGTIHGEYQIQSQFRGEESKILTFNLLPPYLETKFVEKKIIQKAPVPEWIKENVKWWANGSIGDDSFKLGISFMIKEGIITIDDLPESSGVSEEKIPDWVKNNAKWWADGVIDESDFVNGLKYLVEKGIIGVN